MNDSAHFWSHLLSCSDVIATLDGETDDALDSLQTQLETLVELYRKEFDPAEEFEAYVALTLCQSITQVLSRVRLNPQALS